MIESQYSYDARNRLTGLQTPDGDLYNFAYDPASRPSEITYLNGVVSSYIFDAAAQLRSLVHHRGGQNISSVAYTYDSAGNRISEMREDGNVRTLDYDANDRLISAVSTV